MFFDCFKIAESLPYDFTGSNSLQRVECALYHKNTSIFPQMLVYTSSAYKYERLGHTGVSGMTKIQWDHKRNLAMRTWEVKSFTMGKKDLLSKMRP